MCGILGFSKIDLSNEKQNLLLQNMGLLQMHRGPDKWGQYLNSNVAFGHNRLSIIDINGGSQPMRSYDNRYLIVFNGEIYNYQELKNDLINRGVKFISNSDTEVIINGFSIEGVEFIKKLNGMFAFAIYDQKNSDVYLFRDRFGIKPLYYSSIDDTLVFSSEIKPIVYFKKYLNQSIKINSNQLPFYFHYRSIPGHETLLESVYKIEPGCYLKKSINSQASISRYINILDNSSDKNHYFTNKVSDIFDSALENSTKMHLQSDVPLGVFLSGGIDSSMIALYASKFNLKHAYNISVDAVYDESKYAQFVSSKLNLNLKLLKYNSSVFKEYLNYWNFINDDPVADPSGIALMALSDKASRDGIKVMLCGDGSDELFLGYNSYLKYLFIQRLPSFFPFNIIRNYFFKKYSNLIDYNKVNSFLGNAHISNHIEKKSLFNEKSLQEAVYKKYGSSTKGDFRYHDLIYRLPNDILSRTDRATMAFSIEARVPFLENNIYNLLKLLSQYQLIDVFSFQTKKIIKKVGLKYFPKKFIYRKKIGFEVPINKWLFEDLKDEVYTYIHLRRFEELNYKYILEKYEMKSNIPLLWAWIQLEFWLDNINSINETNKHQRFSKERVDNYFLLK